MTEVRVISARTVPQEAVRDLWDGLKRHDLWVALAVHEIRQRFRRSLLGPFWITASMGVFIAALTLISATVFGQNMQTQLPYIATGVIIWGFITTNILEGANVFIAREGYIRNVPLPVSVHLYQVVMRNLVILGFNMVIYVIIEVVAPSHPWTTLPLVLVSWPLLILNVTWMSLVAGVLSARFRDIPQVIASLVQIVFFLTPVFWSTASMQTRPHFVVLNPLYHLLTIARDPLLGVVPPLESWIAAFLMALAGCVMAAWLYRRAQPRIAFWI